MTDADLARLDQLCDLRVAEVAGASVRVPPDELPDGHLDRVVQSFLEQDPSLERAERVVNHVHAYDEFQDLSEDEYDEAALRLFAAWNGALKRLDPAFRVEKYDDYGPTVTFYKAREA